MNNILQLLIFIQVNFCTATVGYRPFSYADFIEESNIIVYGRIISVNKNDFKISIIKKVKLNSKVDTLVIQRNGYYYGNKRYSEYIVGQEAIYFLENSNNKKLYILESIKTGELIVKESMTYIEEFDFNKLKAKTYDFLPKDKKYITLEVGTVIEGINIYLKNIEVIKREFFNYHEGKVVYQYSFIDRLPCNDFLSIVIAQKRRQYRIANLF